MTQTLLTRSFWRFSPRGQWTYALLVPWFVPFISYLFIGDPYGNDIQTFAVGTLTFWLMTTVAFMTHDWAATAIARRYPSLRQTIQRSLLLFVAFSFLSGSFLAVYTWFFIQFKPFNSQLTYDSVALVYIFDLGAIFILVLLYETLYSLAMWQENRLGKEQLKKARLQSQLQSLKSQINPHFLFNSLNSLSSMIADEPERAEQFVDEMAKVYRYLLQNNEQELTTLAVELNFIQSYYHLLRTRHGLGLHLHVSIEDSYMTYQIPPLTLQLLVENAVKHNIIQTTKPLTIEIYTSPEGNLHVRNNLQAKTARIASNRVGLANIIAKYQLLATTQPIIDQSSTHFTVTLPLLAPLTSDKNQ
ncbi:sensor histidine kinase [Tellurirhabdus bombi]|uniref:sensor histidine kinase n=1 Tax=Tellurirhabdus bombi TaxID=2907205 RepID=UPI001F4789EF|nr:histidine kinase [Tellurirhabdus bombi]